MMLERCWKDIEIEKFLKNDKKWLKLFKKI